MTHAPAELLLAEASARGIRLEADAGRLRFDAPRGAMTPELAERLRAMKPALLAILTAARATGDAQAVPLDLSRILPPATWLTPKQRRLWRERTAANVANGMSRTEAEQEAMAELVMTGALASGSEAGISRREWQAFVEFAETWNGAAIERDTSTGRKP